MTNKPRAKMPKHVKLKVQDARKKDIGKSIIRLDTETMEELGISTGDIVEIIGEKSSAAKAWPSYPQDEGLGIIRIDSRVRRNAGISVDEMVTIQKANAQNAKSIVLTPHEIKIKTNARFESFVRRKLLSFPVTKDDLILLSLLLNSLGSATNTSVYWILGSLK